MLGAEPIEFILRALPEGLLFVFAIYIFSKTKINKKKYFITSLIFSIFVYGVRMLPINYGVHMVLSLLFLLFLVVYYNKIDVVTTIRSIIFIYLIQFISEALNIWIINSMNLDLEGKFKNPIHKSIIGLPSLIITIIIILIISAIINKRKKLKNI